MRHCTLFCHRRKSAVSAKFDKKLGDPPRRVARRIGTSGYGGVNNNVPGMNLALGALLGSLTEPSPPNLSSVPEPPPRVLFSSVPEPPPRANLFSSVPEPPPRVNLTLFVASKCPDAPRCETFLRPVLQEVGSLVDLQLEYIGTPNPQAAYGVDCLHGPTECVGNAVQLCTQRHFPFTVDIDTDRLGPHLSWSLFLRCVGRFNSTAESAIPANTNGCLQQLGVPSSLADRMRKCVEGPEGTALLQASVARTLSACGAHSSAPRRGCKSCTMALEGAKVCVLDDGEKYNCTGMQTAQVRAVPTAPRRRHQRRRLRRHTAASAPRPPLLLAVAGMGARHLHRRGRQGAAPRAAARVPRHAAAAARARLAACVGPLVR